MIGLPNISLSDIIVFTTGFHFGSLAGAATGILTWMVYGAINPFGFSFPIWMATMAGEAIFGFVGGILGRSALEEPEGESCNLNYNLEMALWGFLLTLIYDLLTNIVYAITFGMPILLALATGWMAPPWFGPLHEGSNAILFFLGVGPLSKAINGIKGEKYVGVLKS